MSNECFPIINLKRIFNDNKETIKNNTNNFNFLLIFYLLPIVFSIILLLIKTHFLEKNVTLLITVLSILEGFLFNALVLMVNNFKYNNKEEKVKINKLKYELIKEVKINLLYEIVIIMIELLLIISLFLIPDSKSSIFLYFSYCIYFFIYYFFTKIFIMLLIILKKLYALIIYDK